MLGTTNKDGRSIGTFGISMLSEFNKSCDHYHFVGELMLRTLNVFNTADSAGYRNWRQVFDIFVDNLLSLQGRGINPPEESQSDLGQCSSCQRNFKAGKLRLKHGDLCDFVVGQSSFAALGSATMDFTCGSNGFDVFAKELVRPNSIVTSKLSMFSIQASCV